MGIDKNINECRLVVEYHRVCDERNSVPACLGAGHHVSLVEYSEWNDNKNFKFCGIKKVNWMFIEKYL